MTETVFRSLVKKVHRLVLVLFSMFSIVGIGLFAYLNNPSFFKFNAKNETLVSVSVEIDEDLIENGIHMRTGLIDAEGLMTVVNNCTNCHSSKLVTQNRMNTEGWIATIEWMQETQNLWDLGGNQEIIVNYLVINYPVQKKGRRMALTNIDWYELE